MGIADFAAAYTSEEVTQTIGEQTIRWKVRVLTPADGARAGKGLGALAMAAAPEDDKPAPKLTLDKVADFAEYADRIACQAIEAVDTGDGWERVKVVFPNVEDVNASPPRISVAMLSRGSGALDQVVAVATRAMLEGASRARSFREG